LNVNPDSSPVRQKKRVFAQERDKAVAEEVRKLLEAGFIREVYYPDWLANVVMVRKNSGKWRICVDFTDLNRACPKDSYSFPRIDTLVDSTARHSLLSFMDAFSGYNQIMMSEEDQERTFFVTSQGLFYYKVMPFGLKNVGATYLPAIKIDGENKSLKAFYGSKAIGVNPHCENMEVAVALAAYLGGEEAQEAHYEMRNIIPTNNKVLQNEKISTDMIATATQKCIEKTAILQPFLGEMSNYWIPAENFGKAIIARDVTKDNATEMTEALNKSINSSVVDSGEMR